MEIYDHKRSHKDLAQQVTNVFRFSETKMSQERPTFHFGDFPFAVSVFCSRQEQGYIADYWVSGRRWSDDEPRLVMRVTTGINELENIEGAVHAFWDDQLQGMAFGSAMVGGFYAANATIEMTKRVRDDMLTFHLHAHDRFHDAMGDQKKSRVAKTARWHNLIRSFGVKQTQKILAEHQWADDLAEEGMTAEEFEKRDRNRAAAINARLMTARKQGLLIELPPTEKQNSSTKGRKQK